MVAPLPLFKFAALFVRHVSKYGANYIKAQAHDHPKFREYAARGGQAIHQISMRLQVTLLRDRVAERRAKERAEAPTVKTEEQTRVEEKAAAEKAKRKEQSGQAGETQQSVWKRRFRPLPETKAVDLFADVIGDAFILLVASGLIIYEYQKAATKPDTNAENIKALRAKLEELEEKDRIREEEEARRRSRVETLEQAIEEMKKATAAAKGTGKLSKLIGTT